MVVWGEYYAGECIHEEPALRCRICGPDASRDFWSSPLALIVAVLTVAGLLLLAPGAVRQEQANDAAALAAHKARLEQARPGAMDAYRAMVAEHRRPRQ